MENDAADNDSMGGFESIMWDLERDPHLASTFSNLSILDQPPDRDVLRSRMQNALKRVPRLAQRVIDSPYPWKLPRWVDDPDMDLDRHLRWLDLGGRATREELNRLVAELSAAPLDRARPLWEFIVIVGLADGRAAMLQRLHHTITDGEGGIRLSVEFLDFERNPPAPAPAPATTATERPGTDGTADPTADRTPEEHHDSTASPGRDDHGGGSDTAAAGFPVTPRGLLDRTIGSITAATDGASQLYGTVRSAGRQAMVGSRRSPIWTERSLDRWFGTTALNLEDVVTAARAMDASVNDVFMAGAASAAGQLHAVAGVPVEQLRASMPISTRHDRSAGGNAFSPTQMLVPTGEMSPRDRVTAIHDIVVQLRQEKAIAAMGSAANAVAAAMPKVLIIRTGQHLTRSVDFVCSNVRAAPFDLFIGGALMQANYPIGPLAGTAFNLTTMSYRGWLWLGLHVDTAAIEDPQRLLDTLEDCYGEILGAAGQRRRTPDAV